MNEDATAGFPRFHAAGRTFVYVLPCRDEDLLKIGFSRDPVQRMRNLHRRYFRFFDLDRAMLLDAESLRGARRIERLLISRFSEHRAPAPLVVRQIAAGKTEWFRGVAPRVDALVRHIADQEALVLHSPLRLWLRQEMAQNSDAIFEYSSRVLEAVQFERFNVSAEETCRRVSADLRELLELYEELDLPIERLVSSDVWAWYRSDGETWRRDMSAPE